MEPWKELQMKDPRWPGFNQMGLSLFPFQYQAVICKMERGDSWFLQRGAGDAAKLAVEWEHLALKEPNLQRRFNPWHLLRFCTKAWWVQPSRSSSSVACFPRTRPQPLCQTEATPPCAPKHTLRVSIKSSNVPVSFFLSNDWRSTYTFTNRPLSPHSQSQKWHETNTQQKQAFPLWDKGVAKVMQRMAAPNECERGAAERKSQSEESLFKEVAKEGSQSEQEELSAFRKGPEWNSWNTSDAAAVPIGWLSERRGLMLLYLLILFEKGRKKRYKKIITNPENK